MDTERLLASGCLKLKGANKPDFPVSMNKGGRIMDRSTVIDVGYVLAREMFTSENKSLEIHMLGILDEYTRRLADKLTTPVSQGQALYEFMMLKYNKYGSKSWQYKEAKKAYDEHLLLTD